MTAHGANTKNIIIGPMNPGGWRPIVNNIFHNTSDNSVKLEFIITKLKCSIILNKYFSKISYEHALN